MERKKEPKNLQEFISGLHPTVDKLLILLTSAIEANMAPSGENLRCVIGRAIWHCQSSLQKPLSSASFSLKEGREGGREGGREEEREGGGREGGREGGRKGGRRRKRCEGEKAVHWYTYTGLKLKL